MHKGGLVKSVKFKNHKYVGDPINAVKLFNDKEVDEIALIDIDATRNKKAPDIKKIREIASEAFMPMAYGGGITDINQIKEIFYNGIEKVILNKSAFSNGKLIAEAANQFGSQSVVASIDVKKQLFKGYKVYVENGNVNTGIDPVEYAKRMMDLGAGEILLNNIDRDGTYKGYDLDLIHKISSAVSIPIIALGGAGSLSDFLQAINNGAAAVSAGSLFVFQRPHNAVLVSYPSQQRLKDEVYKQINRRIK